MTKTSIYEIKGKIALLVLLLVGLFIIGIGYNEKSDKKNIYISEICSHNDTIVYDNYGDFHDYIELHNRGNESVDLDGWYLTDSLNDVSNRRLLLDEIVLEGGDYYIAFVAKELCDYALSEGDCIYLFDSSGKEVDAVKVPKIDDEKSYAFLEDEGKWVNNLASTPGKKNENITIEVETEVLGKAFIPEFSVESGFYNTDFYLEMETEEGCEIYYTVDGSRPTTESILYNGPIYISDATKKPNKWCERTDLSVIDYEVPNYLVDKCTIIRAASFDKDGRCSEEKAASYFVDFDGRYGYGKGYTVSIISEPDNLFSDEKGIYVIGSVGKMNHDTLDLGYNAIVNYTKDGKGWRRPAIIHVFDENKNCIYQQEILLGIHGGYSTREVQKSFNLIAKEGERILPGLFGDKHESLILRAGGVNDTASTKIRDVLNQSLVEERNITTQKAFPCQVFLDGEYWGLYNLQERLDPAMIASKYNISKDNIILLKNGNVLGKDNTYSNYYKQVLDYAKSNDLSKTEKYLYTHIH